MSRAIRMARRGRLKRPPHGLMMLSCHTCLMENPGSSTIAATIYNGTAVCWTHALFTEIRGDSPRQTIIDEIMRSGYWDVK